MVKETGFSMTKEGYITVGLIIGCTLYAWFKWYTRDVNRKGLVQDK